MILKDPIGIKFNSFKIKCPGCFTVSWYTFWDPIFFDEKSIIQAILRYMGHQKWTKSQI